MHRIADQVLVGMKDWVIKLDDILRLSERDILTHAGKITHDDAIKHANTQFDQFQHEKSLVEQTLSTKETVQHSLNDNSYNSNYYIAGTPNYSKKSPNPQQEVHQPKEEPKPEPKKQTKPKPKQQNKKKRA